MSFLNPPQVVSIVGDAQSVRHVYIASLGKSYSIWSSELTNGHNVFAYRETDPINFAGDVLFDDIVIKCPSKIKHFSALQYGGPTYIILAWDDGKNIWSMSIDFSNGNIISTPSIKFQGILPTLTEHSSFFRVNYINGSDLKSRIGFDGSELIIADVSGYSILDNDTDFISEFILKYTALYGTNTEIAREFQVEANTKSLVDSQYSFLDIGAFELEEKIEGTIGVLGQNTITREYNNTAFYFDDYSNVVEKGIKFLQNPVLTLNPNYITISIWLDGEPTVMPYDTILITAKNSLGNEAFGISLPWSDNKVYWRCGSDTISQIVSVGSYATGTGLSNWIFSKHVADGKMFIFRNGGLIYSEESKYGNYATTITNLLFASAWRGHIGSITIFGMSIIDSNLASFISHNGPNYNWDPVPTHFNPLLYHWTFNSHQEADSLDDLSGNNNYLYMGSLKYRASGSLPDEPISFPFLSNETPNYPVLPIGSQFTIEAWITPSYSVNSSYIVKHTNLSFGFNNDGEAFFEFNYGGSIIRYQQHSSRLINYGVPNYIAVSHMFGQLIPPTFLVVNGSIVKATWDLGNGKENAVITELNKAKVILPVGSKIHSIRVSNVAKTQNEILDYLRGRS